MAFSSSSKRAICNMFGDLITCKRYYVLKSFSASGSFSHSLSYNESLYCCQSPKSLLGFVTQRLSDVTGVFFFFLGTPFFFLKSCWLDISRTQPKYQRESFLLYNASFKSTRVQIYPESVFPLLFECVKSSK